MTIPVTVRAHEFYWITLSVMLSACSTMADVVGHQNDGTARIYEVSSAQAWELAKIVFRTEGADAIEEHRSEGYMLTSSGSNFYSRGAVMGAWIEPSGGNRTNVTVVTKRRVKTNLFTTLTEGTFHRRFAQGIRIINSGSALPVILPDSYDGKGAQPLLVKDSTLHPDKNGAPRPLIESDGACGPPIPRSQMVSVDNVK